MKRIKEIIAIAITTSLLTACLPAAFLAGATAGGSIIADRRTVGTIMQDQKITYKALIQLNSEPQLKNEAHLSVTSFNGVVLILGQAPSRALKKRAYELIKIIPNIRRINNEISVGPPLEASERSHDAWITTKVKAALVAEKGLNSTQIKVVTESNTVYLLGIVTHQQAEMAINVARQLEGVSKVVTLFEFTV